MILYLNLINGSFLKVGYNVNSKTILHAITKKKKSIGLSCTLCDFVTSYIGQLVNTGSLNCVNVPNWQFGI